MGLDKLSIPFNYKRDIHAKISNIRVVTSGKVSLIRISSDEIKSKRTPAYRYLLP